MWIIQWNKADLGSYPHKVVHFPSSSASFSTSNVSSFQVGWFYKYRDVSWRSQQSNWSQLIPRHQILEKSVTWIVICSLFFLAICSSSALTTIRLNICNNHCIFNTFVLIPSTPDSQAFSLPEKKKTAPNFSQQRSHAAVLSFQSLHPICHLAEKDPSKCVTSSGVKLHYYPGWI